MNHITSSSLDGRVTLSVPIDGTGFISVGATSGVAMRRHFIDASARKASPRVAATSRPLIFNRREIDDACKLEPPRVAWIAHCPKPARFTLVSHEARDNPPAS